MPQDKRKPLREFAKLPYFLTPLLPPDILTKIETEQYRLTLTINKIYTNNYTDKCGKLLTSKPLTTV